MKIQYQKIENGLEILRIWQDSGIIKVPEQIEGIPVIRIAPYTFSLHKDGEEKNSEDEFDPMAQMNKNMNMMFPVMYLFVALIAPLGLALYWLMNSLLMIIEKLVLNKLLKDEEED